MANLNKVVLIGRLTRDPECRTFSTGGKVAKFGFAVNNRRKNSQSGQWEDEPMFIDCEAFNRGEFGKLADRIETYCRKGNQICIEGRLHLDQWDDKTTGQKRSKHKIVVDELHLLEGRQDGQGGQRAMAGAGAPAGNRSTGGASDDMPQETGNGGGDGDIPF